MKLDWDIHELIEFGNRVSNQAAFEKYLSESTKEIAKKLHQMLILNTPVDFGNLQMGWKTSGNYSYLVEKKGNGYEVTLINRTLYALWVNDGHRQRPGRFIPGYRDANGKFRYDPEADGGIRLKKAWVDGKFFVERSILELNSTTEIERIIYKQLNEWFRWCING